jgi:hypothetical protein
MCYNMSHASERAIFAPRFEFPDLYLYIFLLDGNVHICTGIAGLR